MSFTLATSGSIIWEAGVRASSTLCASGAYLQKICDKAEGTFSALTRFDWVANWASVGTNFKSSIEDAVSQLAGMKIIKDDMSGFTSREEAQTMCDIMKDNIAQIVATLKEQENREALGV